jgi:hypothetical protein
VPFYANDAREAPLVGTLGVHVLRGRNRPTSLPPCLHDDELLYCRSIQRVTMKCSRMPGASL